MIFTGIVASRSLQFVLRRLLSYLPRLGMLSETCRLLETIQQMEIKHPVGPGAITEFDRVFEIGCRAITQCLVVSSADWREKKSAEPAVFSRRDDSRLIRCLEHLVEGLFALLAHAQPRRAALRARDGR